MTGEKTALAAAEDAYTDGDFEAVRTLVAPLANDGDADAQVWLAMLYLNGQGVEPNEKQALDWFLRAAETGNVVANANAGALLLMGNGVEQDCQRGAQLLSQAADQGDINALYNLGAIYSSGDKVPEDLEKAADCYRRAAEIGHYPSQSRLGYMYSQGRGVAKDRVQAFLWLTLAAQHGIGTALNALESVSNAMSADEKEQGLRLFDQWRGRTESVAGPATILPLPT